MVIAAPDLERARAIAGAVRDPELPMLTLEDLGILRSVAREDDGWVRASERCLEAMGLPHEFWSPAVLAERLPFLRFAGAHFALFTPTGGVLFAERILTGLGRWLSEQGAAVHLPESRIGELGEQIRRLREDSADRAAIAAAAAAAGAVHRSGALVELVERVAAAPRPTRRRARQEVADDRG